MQHYKCDPKKFNIKKTTIILYITSVHPLSKVSESYDAEDDYDYVDVDDVDDVADN
jgi:hypothetical protein